jgi:RHS repeat-associated protein
MGPGTFDIGAAGWDGLPADNWSMRAEALLSVSVAGVYTVWADGDGGTRVFLNDTKVSDGWDNADGVVRTAPPQRLAVWLEPGKRVKIRVEYRDRGGNANWSLKWQPPGQSESAVPQPNLQPNYGLVTRTVDPEGRVTRTGYADPASGQPNDVVQELSGQPSLVTRMTYEPDSATTGWRRQLTKRLPSGDSSQVTYDYYGDQGEPVANSCGVGSSVIQAGRPRSTTAADPDGTGPQQAIRRWYVYDEAGRTRGLLTTSADVAEVNLGSQPWVCTSFDTRGRPTSTDYPAFSGAAARTVTHDYANPLAASVSDPAGIITQTVDLLGRATRYEDVHGAVTTSTYDVANRPLSTALLGQTTTNTYLPDGLLDTVRINGQVVSDSTYATDGRLTSVSYPSGTDNSGNGTTGEFGYDTLLRPSSVTWRGPSGALIASENVTRYNSGNLRERWYDGNNLNGSNPDFAYDGAGRLTSATVGTTVHSYAFADTNTCGTAAAGKNSNRTSKTVAGVTRTYCYDEADRLTSTTEPSVGTINYDSRGNTTQIFGESHTYDIADRHLTTTKGATTVAYVRDATDRFTERKVNGATVARYLSAGGGDAPDATIDVATGNTEFVWGLPGGALFTYKPSAVASSVWTLPNLQGSALATVNQSGVKQGATMIWDPDGNNLAGGVPNNMPGSFDYGWLGQHQRPVESEAGLSPIIEMGARQYSPILGRFLEVDPLEGGASNDYSYALDPINSSDLDGRCVWLDKSKCGKKPKLSFIPRFIPKPPVLAPKPRSSGKSSKVEYRTMSGKVVNMPAKIQQGTHKERVDWINLQDYGTTDLASLEPSFGEVFLRELGKASLKCAGGAATAIVIPMGTSAALGDVIKSSKSLAGKSGVGTLAVGAYGCYQGLGIIPEG